MGTDDKPQGKSCNGEVSHQLIKGVKGAAGGGGGGGGGRLGLGSLFEE